MADQDFAYQFRLILLGDSTVGKSSILRQFKEGVHYPDISLTVGVDFHAKLIKVRGKSIKLQLWDTAGQDRFRAIVRAYYRNAVGGLLVFDITNRESFADLGAWLEDAKRNAEPHKPVFVLVGNKTDQEKHREVRKEEGAQFAKDNGMEYFETSALSGSNVEEVFNALAQRICLLLEEGSIQVQEGWDGVKRGSQHSSLNSSGHSFYNGFNSQKLNSTVTLSSGRFARSQQAQIPKKKCC